MTLPMYLMLAAAVLSIVGPVWNWTMVRLGLPRLPSNATGAALGVGYFIGQALYLDAPNRPLTEMLDEMFMIDVGVIGLVFCKAISRCPVQEFASGREQLRCLLKAPTKADRVVLACFPLMWAAYVLEMNEAARWWALWALAMGQFAAAGTESFFEWRKANAPIDKPDIPSSGLMRIALTRAGEYG